MKILTVILFIYFFQSSYSRPLELKQTKSLDQPAGDLEWESWLHENQPKLGKITPKSIFEVRPHGPLSLRLPPCEGGYQSSAFSPCVANVDTNAHFEYLLKKLSLNTYDPSDYEDLEEEKPFQISIPIEKSGEIYAENKGTGNIGVEVPPDETFFKTLQSGGRINSRRWRNT